VNEPHWPGSALLEADARLRRRVLAAVAGVALLAALTFLPCLTHDFVRWDDNRFITDAAWSRQPGVDLTRILRGAFPGYAYYPAFHASLWLDWVVWGLNPSGFHLTNILLHAANALLAFLVAWRVFGHAFEDERVRLRAAALTAALFALHPVNVEPVAWVSGRKVLLATLFGLLAFEAVQRSAARPIWRVAAAVAFGLACLSNVAVSGMALIMVAWDICVRGRAPLRAVLSKADFLLMVAGVAVLRYVRVAAERDVFGSALGPGDRLPQVVHAAGAELLAVLVPVGLTNRYGFPEAPWHSPVFWLAIVALIGTFALLRRWGRDLRSFLLLWFWLGLAPTVLHHHPRADRHLYLPAIGLFGLAAVGVVRLAQASRPRLMAVFAAAAVLVCLALAGLAQAESQTWRDTVSLWRQNQRQWPHLWHSHHDLGEALNRRQEFRRAIVHLDRAIALNPGYGYTWESRGTAWSNLGDYDRAIADYGRAIELLPGEASALYNRGVALYRLGHIRRAIRDYSRALSLDANLGDTWYNRALAYLKLGDYLHARTDYDRVLELNAEDVSAYRGRALCHYELKDYEHAWADVESCRRLGGSFPEEFMRALTSASGRRR